MTNPTPQGQVPEAIAGALFDFAGFLTTLPKERAVTLSGAHLATPVVDLLTEWAKTRGLNLDEANVKGWVAALTAAPTNTDTNTAIGAADLSLQKRVIFDAIRSAYDLGYSDARNARSTPGDSAPGYKGRQVEADHGGALSARIAALASAQAQPVAAPAAQPAPAAQQEAQEPCPTCAALARTVMLDQVSFDRKPDCYGIRQITDDEGVEEWEDIRTSPDVAREEANDMMATGRGEIYEVVPLWTTPQPSPTAQAKPDAGVLEDAAKTEWDAELGRTAMRFVDRAGDVHPGIDSAEKICADFYAAMSDVIEQMPWVRSMNASIDAAMAEKKGDTHE